MKALASLALAVFALGCGAAAPPPSVAVAPVVAPQESRATVTARLETKLAADPNRAICDRLALAYVEGDNDALKPIFDADAFVARILARRTLPPDVVERLHHNAAKFEKFSRVLAPPGSHFRCLGTRQFAGAPHLAIRQWAGERFDYILFRLGKGKRPVRDGGDPRAPALAIEDWIVVSGGAYHSEAQALSFDPRLTTEVAKIADMFQKSYDGDFAGIIGLYRTLPAELQLEPPTFVHFINSVYQTEPPGSALYAEATTKLGQVFAGRDIAIAYWQLTDGRRRHDARLVEDARARLLAALDDYELIAEGS